MAKGSQLSQLKSAVAQAGLNRQSQPSKKRKRTPAGETDKDKRANKLKEIHEKLNPFDVKITKLKHDVGGRKLKGVTGKPSKTKQAGLEQRKKTLLKEYAERGHVGGIVDRRFGENDAAMTPEERMLERFTKERQRAAKGVNFNLEDEEELTHYGQSLSHLDDFDNVGLGADDMDEDDDGKIDQETVKRVHFGGFEDEEDEEDGEDGEEPRKKSKAEVMAEVIAKSKMHKAQRQLEREQDDNTRHQLDQEFNDIRSLLLSGGQDSTKDVFDKINADKEAQYDQSVRELALDRRAQPKDRTKTEDELAQEAKEALEKAERKRLKRMRGEPDDDDSSEEESAARGGKRKKSRGVVGGDDLEEDFDLEEDEDDWAGLGAGIGAKGDAKESGEEDNERDGEDKDEEGDEEESDEDEDNEDAEVSGEEEEGSESDDGGEEEEDEDESESESEPEAKVSAKRSSTKAMKQEKKTKALDSSELPYTFPCPEDHDEFLEIVDGVKDVDVPTVVKRIRALYHPSLAEGNKAKLQTLTEVLIDYIMHVTSPPTPRFGLLASLLPHLYSLSLSYPNQTASYFVSKLKIMQKNLTRGLGRSATAPDSKTWPGSAELALLWTISHVFPTSDMNHVVVTPARLLIGSYLGLCRIRSLQDLASGLFLCTIVLEYENLSKRLVPEAINFLLNAILRLHPHPYKGKEAVPGSFPCLDFTKDKSDHLRMASGCGGEIKAPSLLELFSEQASSSEQDKVDLLALAVDLLCRFSDYYKSLDGFIELYQPVLEILETMDGNEMYSGQIATRISNATDGVRRLLKFARQSRKPLALQAHKPIPIASYIPKIDSSSSTYLRRNDPDHERAEAAKLRYQYKQEKKGAIRELRKDARFLSSVQQQEQIEKDRTYKEKMNKVFSSFESERAEQKKMDKEKAREKKRAGRK